MNVYIMPTAAAWGKKIISGGYLKNLKTAIDCKNVRVAYKLSAYGTNEAKGSVTPLFVMCAASCTVFQ